MKKRAFLYRDHRDEAYAGDPNSDVPILRVNWKPTSIGFAELIDGEFRFFLSTYGLSKTHLVWCGSVTHAPTGTEMEFNHLDEIGSCKDAKLLLARMKEHILEKLTARGKK